MVEDSNDDDIEDELRKLTEEVGELTDLLKQAFAERPAPEEAGEEAEGDLWDTGQTSIAVDSVDDYKRIRSQAAQGEAMTIPYFSDEAFDSNKERIKARVKLFEQGFDSLQSLKGTLGNEDFKRFVIEYTKEYLTANAPGGASLTIEMLEILEPSPSFLGITEVEGEIELIQPKMPMSFSQAVGDYWHAATGPNPRLGLSYLGEPELIPGQMKISELNEELASAIRETKPAELPHEAIGLLPLEEQEYYE